MRYLKTPSGKTLIELVSNHINQLRSKGFSIVDEIDEEFFEINLQLKKQIIGLMILHDEELNYPSAAQYEAIYEKDDGSLLKYIGSFLTTQSDIDSQQASENIISVLVKNIFDYYGDTDVWDIIEETIDYIREGEKERANEPQCV